MQFWGKKNCVARDSSARDVKREEKVRGSRSTGIRQILRLGNQILRLKMEIYVTLTFVRAKSHFVDYWTLYPVTRDKRTSSTVRPENQASNERNIVPYDRCSLFSPVEYADHLANRAAISETLGGNGTGTERIDRTARSIYP